MEQCKKKLAAPFAASILVAGLAATGVAAQGTQNTQSGTGSTGSRTSSSSSRSQGGTGTSTVGGASASGTSQYSASDRAMIQSLSARLTPTEQRTFTRMMTRLSSQERQVLLKVARGGSYGAGTSGATGTGSGTTGGTGTGTGTSGSTGSGTTGSGTGTGTGTGGGGTTP